jgi:hypothetical protein
MGKHVSGIPAFEFDIGHSGCGAPASHGAELINLQKKQALIPELFSNRGVVH